MEQENLFGDTEWWQEHWQDMPEFIQNDLSPWQTILIHFQTPKDRDDFARLINQKMTHKIKMGMLNMKPTAYFYKLKQYTKGKDLE